MFAPYGPPQQNIRPMKPVGLSYYSVHMPTPKKVPAGTVY